MGKTLVLIKPEAIKFLEKIKKDISSKGFEQVDSTGIISWEKNLIEKTYSADRLNYGSKEANELMAKYIPHIIFNKFEPNPLVEALLLESEGNTIEDFKRLCGPRDPEEYKLPENRYTLRGKYGLGYEHSFLTFIGGKPCRFVFNGLHRPSSEEEFEIDKKIYFT